MGSEKRFNYIIGFIFTLVFLILHSFSFLLQAAELKLPEEIYGNIQIGPLKVHPFLNIKEEYTDNVFLEYRDEKGDFINTVSPGLLLFFPLQRHLLQLEYTANLISYDKYSEHNTQDQLANILLNLDFPAGLNLKFGNDWVKSSVPPDFEEDARSDFDANIFSVEAIYKLTDLYKVKLFYTNEFKEFDSYRKPWQSDPKLDNYKQDDVGLTLYYRFLPLTSLLLEYGVTHINNNDKGFPSTDSDSQRIWLGLTWEATANINGNIKVGYLTRDYDGPGDDWDGMGMEADLRYHLSSFTSISFKGFRRLEETTVTKEAVEFGEYGTYYVSTGGILSLTHRFNYKLSASAEVSYFSDNYLEEGQIGKKREDDKLGFGVGLDYQIQDWLGCSLQYNHTVKDSNIEREEFRKNRVIVTISLAF